MTITWHSHPCQKIEGDISVPGDKSISHRSIMLGALAEGTTEVSGFLEGEDCLATLRAFQAMGVPITHHGEGKVTIKGQGLYGLQAPKQALDVGNSGTSMRLMAGVLAGQNFSSTLIGDQSLMKRPMRRVTQPLTQMGADIQTSETGTAPLVIHGKPLKGIDFQMSVASAQLKSCLLLAGLYAKGETHIHECGVSRDHSERMLRGFGVQITQEKNTLSIVGGQSLKACNVMVPGDISSAAFFIVAALIAKEGSLRIQNVGINPTRAAVIDILQQMGGNIQLENIREAGGEPVADLIVHASSLKGIHIPEALVPIAIDEFPILFIAAACAQGETTANDLAELRVKESDRLAAMEAGLKILNIDCETTQDSIHITGGEFSGGTINSHGDHRIAMSFAIAALRSSAPIGILDCANVATSFPNFQTLTNHIGMQIEAQNA
ncbi:3-phosphoshikimate 1-carboxyvinyltransferase [Suttonella ornithocola]|uniref:3-phosphoshikimate 1-carboxyvinyltransferase n=1 Tax=Suttonella ornithocola TaxID=279832 RepID=A0A380MQ69_9GAMM|nr:3-phosphoshikimate 1-carboxyvinyltransferase [Suttonella ornithocola]SUO94759.1 3-phosphoshikimate 1-carboxyvinyltransferase [Suttonella ornithocola]